MAYAFKRPDRVADQVREIAAEQVDKAIEAIVASDDFDVTVHGLRRSCKKLRALLKLVRPVFADYALENAAIKAIADRFSVARDAAVMVETISAIIAGSSGRLAADGAEPDRLAGRLRARAGHLREQMGEAELLALAKADFEQVRERIAAWRFDASGIEIVRPGLAKAYRRFRKGLAAVRRSPDGETVHEWRKAAKVWWYQMRLYERTAPAVLENLVAQLDTLGEMLGDHHNLTVLADWIVSSRGPGDGASDALLVEIAERQNELVTQALALGRQLTAERPRTAADRFSAYWQLLG